MADTAENIEFLLVEVGDCLFALDASAVRSTVAPGDVTPLPFVPDFIEGLISVNEQILTLMDLRLLLGMQGHHPGRTHTELILVDNSRVPCALRVDAVVAKVDIHRDGHQLVSASGDQGEESSVYFNAIDQGLVRGRFEWNDKTVMELAPDALGSLVSAKDIPESRRGLFGRVNSEQTLEAEELLSCVVIALNNETYAIPLEDSVEILECPKATPIPGAPGCIEGIALVREDALLVLGLHHLLGLGNDSHAYKSVIVVEYQGMQLGLRVDDVEGIQSYSFNALRRIEDKGADIEGVIVDQDRVVSLLDVERLFQGSFNAFSAYAPARMDDLVEQQVEQIQLLEVRLFDEYFAFPLSAVRRIAEYSDYESLSEEGDGFVSGAVSLNGEILPVVDCAAVLKMHEAASQNEFEAWVVVGSNDSQWAIPVAQAREIIEVSRSDFEDVQASHNGFVESIVNFENRLVSVLSVDVLDGQEARA